jgi:hypothetical protein
MSGKKMMYQEEFDFIELELLYYSIIKSRNMCNKEVKEL